MMDENCGLDTELSYRIKCARGAFRKLLPLIGEAGGALASHMRGCFAEAFMALVSSVLLYGGETSMGAVAGSAGAHRGRVQRHAALSAAAPLARSRAS